MNDAVPPDTERLRRLNAWLAQGLELQPHERAAWLRALPPDAADLAPQLAQMLAASTGTGDACLEPSARVGPALMAALGVDGDAAGDTIGPYRLIRELGAGGMGTVWLAERADGAMRRQVALKLPHAGWALGGGKRMARERDILASLEHPHIARLYDAGHTEAGRLYLAMEYVEGEPITTYAARHELSVPARLRLLLQVASAVAHAHAHLVVHRDLKPPNILVTVQGEVRLLDFGVAKLLAGDNTDDGSLTRDAGRALTPDYASPEQLLDEPLSAASDVYSLGVVAYELLTGKRPYHLRGASPAALEEAITATEPPLASSRVAGDAITARALRGDVDTILTKAMKKRREERYPSIEAFTADIDRHLRGLPVLAQPDSLAYRAGKFVRRQRWPLAVSALVFAVVVSGVVGTLSQARRAEQQGRLAQIQRDQALRELAYAEAADELMRFLLSEQFGQALTASPLLLRAEQLVERQFADDALLRARLLLMVADLHGELNDFVRAEQVLLRATEAAAASADAAVLAQVACTLAALEAATGRAAAAKVRFDAVMARLDTGADPQALLTCHIQGQALHSNLGDAAAALAHAQAALRLIGTPRPGQRTHAIFLNGAMGDAYSELGDAGKAINAYQQAIDAFASIGRGNTTAAAVLKNNLGVMLMRSGQIRRAVEHFEAQLLEARQQDADDDPVVLINLGRLLPELGRADEARVLLDRAMAQQRVNGDLPGMAHAQLGLASVACAHVKTPACDNALAEAQARMQAAVPPPRTAMAFVDALAAQVALAREQPAQARSRVQAALDRFPPGQPPQALQVRLRALLARAELRLGEIASAQRHAEQASTDARQAAGDIAYTEGQGLALLAMGQVRQAQGDLQGARSAWRDSELQLRQSLGDSAPATLEARRLLQTLPKR